MICGRLNGGATQCAPKTAERQRFGEGAYVASSSAQGHVVTPPNPHCPTPSFPAAASAQRGLMDWLRVASEGSCDYTVRRAAGM